MKPFSIKTKRLIIKPLSDDELEARIASETDGHMQSALEEMLTGCKNDPTNRLWYTEWDIILRENDSLAGSLCFMGPAREHETEIGMGINEAFRRQGIAAEALKTVMEWAFSQDSELMFIMAETTADNEACLALLSKLGFTPAGEGEEGPRFEKERPETAWMSVYMCLGLSVGMCFGASFDNISIGLCLGVAIGMALGAGLDANYKKKRDAVKAERAAKRE